MDKFKKWFQPWVFSLIFVLLLYVANFYLQRAIQSDKVDQAGKICSDPYRGLTSSELAIMNIALRDGFFDENSEKLQRYAKWIVEECNGVDLDNKSSASSILTFNEQVKFWARLYIADHTTHYINRSP